MAGLAELDPVGEYPRKGAELFAELVGSHGFRLELGDRLEQSQPAPSGPPTVSVPLAVNRNVMGTIHFYGPLTQQAREVARMAAPIYATGVRNARRLDSSTQERTYEDVQAMLKRTPLTPRERDVVGRLLSGASTRQIAQSTGLTVATVNTYLKRIFAKLGVHSRVELVARVTGTRGVIPSGPPKAEGDVSTP